MQPRLSGLVGTEQTVRISYSLDKRGRFIHSGIGMDNRGCTVVECRMYVDSSKENPMMYGLKSPQQKSLSLELVYVYHGHQRDRTKVALCITDTSGRLS